MDTTPQSAAPGQHPIPFGDHPALDFLNTLASPRGVETEWLADGGRLCAWLVESGALAPEAAGRLRAAWGPGPCDEVARRARALRAWFRGFVERHAGGPLTGDACGELGPLNDVLCEDGLHQAVVRSGQAGDGLGALALQAVRSWERPEQMLQPIAAAIAELVCREDFSRVRRCEGPGCSVLFLDRTKNHARRFCSAAGCGNRAKQAAHRVRLRQ